MDQMSMDDILTDKKSEPTPVPSTQPATETEPPVERNQSAKKVWEEKEQLAKGRVRDPETGQFVTKPEEDVKEEPKVEPRPILPAVPAVPPVQEFTEKEKAFLKGMQEERSKRQELERRLAAIEAAKPTEPEKTFYDDPDGALAKRDEAFNKQLADMRAEMTTNRLSTAELMARRSHPDFDEKIEVFGELLKQTPGLYQQWLSAPDPAEFAYGLGKTHIELKEAGGIPQLREKIEKETRLKLEAELKAKAEALEKERAALPPSLSDARSKGTNKISWGGPPSMDNILKG